MAGMRQERRRLETRRRIYKAARRLFSEHGYDATTIEQIATAADVARATVFNHFKRKSDLVRYWSSQRGEALRTLTETLQERGGSARELVLTFLHMLAALNEHERRLSQVMVTAVVHTGLPLTPEWQETSAQPFTEAVRVGQHRGEFSSQIDAEEAGALLRDAYMGTLYRWLEGGGDPPFELEEVLIRRAIMILDGISPTLAGGPVEGPDLRSDAHPV